MTPDAIRAFFRETGPASPVEVAAMQQAKSDPQAARDLLAAVSSLAVEDPTIARLLNEFRTLTLMRYIQERCAADAAEALTCAELLVDLMERGRDAVRLGRIRPQRPT